MSADVQARSGEERRVPCPRCGEPVLMIAQQCYRCRADLLVTLEVVRPFADQRQVYAAAKGLCDQFPNLQFSTVRAVLQGKERALLRNTTRSVAEWIGGVLEGHGIEYTIVWRDRPRATESRTGLWVLLAAWVVLGGAGAALYASDLDVVAWVIDRPRPKAAAAMDTKAPDAGVAPAATARELAARIVPATATVLCGPRQGSGFFVAPERLVTNQHVLCEEDHGSLEVVLEDGRRLAATLLRSEERLDAAVLDVKGAAAVPLPLGDSTRVGRGDKVYVVGAPLGMSFTMSQGIVGHATRRTTGLSYIQIDLSITRGNSGGPLVDEEGRVVGLVTYKIGSDATIGLALAINHLYTGDKPLITPPRQYDGAKWEEELQLAWSEDKKDRQQLLENMRKPMLLRARHDGSTYHAAVAYMGDRTPPRRVNFAVVLQTGQCDLDVPIGRWRLIGHTTNVDEDLPPSVRTWVQHNKIETKVQMGIASFDASRCPNRAFVSSGLVLKGGMVGFDRVSLDR